MCDPKTATISALFDWKKKKIYSKVCPGAGTSNWIPVQSAFK